MRRNHYTKIRLLILVCLILPAVALAAPAEG
jgi:hypothetical protein